MNRWRWASLAAVTMLHAGAVAALLPGQETRAPALAVPVLQARLIAEPTPSPPSPRPAATDPPVAKPQVKPPPRPRRAVAPAAPARVAEASVPAATPVASAMASAPPSAPEIADSRPPVREPAAIACSTPAYPAAARRRGESGTVLLQLLIDAEGEVIDRRIERSSGSDALDGAAVQALARCKFQPGTVDGRPHQAWVRLRYVWKLE